MREACVSLLVGLDSDVLEYIVEMFVAGDEAGDDLADALSSFLLSYEHCPNEEEAAGKARELIGAIYPAGCAAGGGAAGGGSTAPRLLSASVNLSVGGDGAQLFKEAEEYELGGRLVGLAEAMEERKKRKAAREEEKRDTRRAHDKVAAQRLAEDASLEAARVEAVRLRRAHGAYLGAVEARPFSMPNPGGGPDLLENASFTMQRGRRYGLIGRNGTGKSTLLRSLASRVLGDFPAALTIHYVSQEIKLDEAAMERTPLQVVLEADSNLLELAGITALTD